MGELNVNTELADHLREHAPGTHGNGEKPGKARIEIIEILEAILLSLVAIATAWSGYQAARWDGQSARAYAESSRLRAESVQLGLSAGQTVAYDAGTLNSWIEATTTGNKELADVMVKRMTPDYREAFEAWIKLDPLNNPDAPAGPRYMPGYEEPQAEQSDLLAEEASVAFEHGVEYRETGEKYVRVTVVLASVLFLVALGQRFRIKGVRYAVTGVAGVLLVYAILVVSTYHRA
jgi:hypothetical protein